MGLGKRMPPKDDIERRSPPERLVPKLKKIKEEIENVLLDEIFV